MKKKYRLISFDVFDTLLIRTCGSPEYIFYLLALDIMGEKTSSNKISDFIQMRMNGERKAISSITNEDEDVTIYDIYAYCDFSIFTTLTNEEIIKKELDIENRNLVAVHRMKEVVQKARIKAEKIAFISDMYIPETFLCKLLSDNGFYQEGDLVLVSSTWKKKKSTGNLFNCLESIVGRRLKNISWKHYGDNIQSDGIQVLKKGGKSHLIKHKQTYYNKWLSLKDININEVPARRFASLLHALYHSRPQTIQTKLIIDLIAPLFVPFVYSILTDAIAKRRKTLFFFARDSYVLYVIAEQFVKELNLNIEIKYLYISRKVIYPILLASTSFEEVIALHEINGELTTSIQTLLENYIPQSILPKHILNDIRYTDQYAKKQDKQELIKIISTDKTTLNNIVNYSQQKKDEIFNYLYQEGFLPNTENIAFVDLAGSRKSQKVLNICLRNNGFNEVFGYYLINMGDNSIIKENNYLSQIQSNQNKIKICLPIIEDFYAITNQGRTIGYQKQNNQYVPVLEQTKNIARKEKLMDQIHSILLQTVSLYIQNKLHLYNQTLAELGTLITIEFSKQPQKDYLKAFDSFSVRENESLESSILGRLSLKEGYLFFQRKQPQSITWRIGSIIRFYLLGKYIVSIYNNREWIKSRIKKTHYYILKLIPPFLYS